MQEEKYEEVWGALMGARDEDHTMINIYDSNRTLWNETLEYINSYSGAGTSISEDRYYVYRTLSGKKIDPNMSALMEQFPNYDTSGENFQEFVEAWGALPGNEPKEGEKGFDRWFKAESAADEHRRILEAKTVMQRIDLGELSILDTDNLSAMVASLMENPPPGLFENINNNYGILNDEAKREVLSSIINSTVQRREIEQYVDPETGKAIITADDLGVGWYDASGNLKDEDVNWFSNVASKEEDMLDDFLFESAPGARLEGVNIIELIEQKPYKNWVDDDGKFRMLRHGENKFREFAGQYNKMFGRNPTVREAMLFKKNGGNLNLMSDDPSVGFTTSMNIRLIPENWIDNYNEPGQLEGIFALLNGGNVTPERAVARTSGWAKFGNIAGNIVASGVGAFATAYGGKLGGPTPQPQQPPTG